MWRVDYSNGGQDHQLNIIPPDSFTTQKLPPLFPRPTSFHFNPTTLPSTSTPPFSLTHRPLGTVAGDAGKKEWNSQRTGVSSRWNPTPEQVRVLEELYKRGTRTPSAEQIQHITAHLSRYGKIEGKNVFYWFQNHKARERQKRRRQLECPSSAEYLILDNFDKNERGGHQKDGLEIELGKKGNSSSDATALISAAATTEGSAAVQQTQRIQLLNSSVPYSCHCQLPNNIITNNDRIMSTHQHDDQEHSPLTLQLFPLKNKNEVEDKDNDDCHGNGREDPSIMEINGFANHEFQFYEFIPLKK